MLKRMVNNAHITYKLIPIDPLLVKSGQASISGAKMAFVSIKRHDGKDEPYLPGSSLKGMLRAYAEKICRTLKQDPVPVCLPYQKPRDKGDHKQDSCGFKIEDYKSKAKLPGNSLSSTQLYRVSCPACRLFGANILCGRLSTADAYLTEEARQTGNYALEIRDGVAIDRLTGGAAPQAKYDLEVLSRGEFTTGIEIRNFERWQLGLVALALNDMEQGLVRIGFGKSRGLGRFRIEISQFSLHYYHPGVTNFSGMAQCCSQSETKAYGFYAGNGNPAAKLPAPTDSSFGLRREFDITSTWKDVLQAGVDDLGAYLGASSWPRDLDQLVQRRH